MIRKLYMPVFLFLALGSGFAFAQDSTDLQELRMPTTVVTGLPVEEAEVFVKQVAPQGWAATARGVPRWDSELCISVVGPPVEQGQFIADRISQRAIDVGLKAGAPGCDTNLLIMITNEPEAVLRKVAEKHRDLFGFTGDANIDTGGSSISLASFLSDTRPIRWRQVIETVSADGMPLDGDPRTGKSGLPENLPVARTDSTRLRSAVRRQLSRVVVVVDTTQTSGIGLGAISDYLAFVTLADVGSDADLAAFPSILNLFNPDAERQSRMTDWDLAFLDGLYAARLNASSGKAQYREIADRMVNGNAGGE